MEQLETLKRDYAADYGAHIADTTRPYDGMAECADITVYHGYSGRCDEQA